MAKYFQARGDIRKAIEAAEKGIQSPKTSDRFYGRLRNLLAKIKR